MIHNVQYIYSGMFCFSLADKLRGSVKNLIYTAPKCECFFIAYLLPLNYLDIFNIFIKRHFNSCRQNQKHAFYSTGLRTGRIVYFSCSVNISTYILNKIICIDFLNLITKRCELKSTSR